MLSQEAWPQVFVFAEGTTTNATGLARFGTGGFRPGVPVQPVTVSYGDRRATVWTREQSHKLLHSLLLIFASPFNKAQLRFERLSLVLTNKCKCGVNRILPGSVGGRLV